jgi:hypothetical protein
MVQNAFMMLNRAHADEAVLYVVPLTSLVLLVVAGYLRAGVGAPVPALGALRLSM